MRTRPARPNRSTCSESVPNRTVSSSDLDVLQAGGQLDSLMRSGLRFCDKLAVIDAHAAGQTEPVNVQRVGPEQNRVLFRSGRSPSQRSVGFADAFGPALL